MTIALLLDRLGGLLAKIPWPVWAAVLLLAGTWYYGHTRYEAGQDSVQKQWDAAVLRGNIEVARLEAEASKVTTIVDTQFVEKIRYVRLNSEALIREIPVYIPADATDLPAGFRLLHDAAVQNTAISGATPLLDAAPVPLATATETILGNYAQCHVAYARVEYWERWALEQCALTNSCK